MTGVCPHLHPNINYRVGHQIVRFVIPVKAEIQLLDYVHIQIEQIGHPVEDGLHDGFLVCLQEVHGAVELMQFQCSP